MRARSLTASTGGVSGKEQQATFIPVLAGTLGGKQGGGWADDLDRSGAFIPTTARPLKSGGNDRQDESHETYVVANGVTARYGKGTDSDAPDTIVLQDVRGGTRDRTDSGQGIGIADGGPCYTLDSTSQHAVAYQQHGSNVGPMGALRAGNGAMTGGVPFVAGVHANQRGEARTSSLAGSLTSQRSGKQFEGVMVAHALTAEGHDASEDGTGRGVPLVFNPQTGGEMWLGIGDMPTALGATQTPAVLEPQMAVRRLTPRECEALQGLPPDWTAVDGDRTPDSPRYRAIGNGMAVPVVEWICKRIVKVDRAARSAATIATARETARTMEPMAFAAMISDLSRRG